MKNLKILTASLIGASMLFGIQSTPSQAGLAILVGGGPVTIVLGAAALLSFPAAFIAGCEAENTVPGWQMTCTPFSGEGGGDSDVMDKAVARDEWTTAGVLFLGVVALDDSSTSPQLNFMPINADQAESLKISEEDRVSYNSNLDEINAIAATITQQTVAFQQTGASKKDVFAKTAALWNQYRDSLAPGAMLTLGKVAAATAQQ